MRALSVDAMQMEFFERDIKTAPRPSVPSILASQLLANRRFQREACKMMARPFSKTDAEIVRNYGRVATYFKKSGAQGIATEFMELARHVALYGGTGGGYCANMANALGALTKLEQSTTRSLQGVS